MKDAKQTEAGETRENKGASEKDASSEKSAGGGKTKLIVIGVALIVLLAGGGAGAYFTLFHKGGGGEGHGGGGAGEAGHHEASAESVVQPVIQEMDTFLVNLSDPGGKRFLKLTMKAKLDAKQTSAEFTTRNFEIRDLVLMHLSGKEFGDIARPEDKAVLKQEIMATLNRALHTGQVQDLYFTEFLVQ